MARLKQLRASIIAGVTEARPTNDFAVPDRLVDRLIFINAANLLYEYRRRNRGVNSIDAWMLTPFECLVPELEESVCLAGDACKTRYALTLPFNVLSLDDDIGIRAWIQDSNTRIMYVAPGMVSMNQHSRYPASHQHPAFTRIDRTLYFWGGNRNFSEVKIRLEAAVMGVVEETDYLTCLTDINVPIPSHLEALVEEATIARILKMLKSEMEDLIEDGTDNVD